MFNEMFDSFEPPTSMLKIVYLLLMYTINGRLRRHRAALRVRH